MDRIESYRFGRIIVDGREFSHDLIIFPDHITDNWWRIEGHKLQPSDLKEIISEKPEVLVVGTGYSGLMHVPHETMQWARSNGIELIARPTKEAAELFNKLPKSKRVVAALHLTC